MPHSIAVLPSRHHSHPALHEIRATAQRLANKVFRTPVWRWEGGALGDMLDDGAEVWLKLELFQKTGTFKVRGAINSIDALSTQARQRGVVAVSAGNHAIAVAYAAMSYGVPAKVVMPAHASPVCIAACRGFGVDVILMPDIHAAFEHGAWIEAGEERTMVHPYDGPLIAQGTATVGLELLEQVPELDAVLVPVGGGGLVGGIAPPSSRCARRVPSTASSRSAPMRCTAVFARDVRHGWSRSPPSPAACARRMRSTTAMVCAASLSTRSCASRTMKSAARCTGCIGT